MRRILFFGAMTLFLAFFTKAAMAEEWDSRVISGYAAGRFSIEGDVKLQVDDLKKEMLGLKESGDGKLVIKVTGMADSLGRSVDNDNLSLKRAEAVTAELGELKADFPQVEISAVPAGDSMNVRQVVVEYKFIPAIVSPIAPISDGRRNERIILLVSLIFAACAVIIAVIILMPLIRVSRQSAKKEKKERKEKEEEKREIEVDGYTVLVWKKEGVWHSPFKTRTGLPVKRISFEDIKKSVTGCMKEEKEEFVSQREELIRKGVIRKKEG